MKKIFLPFLFLFINSIVTLSADSPVIKSDPEKVTFVVFRDKKLMSGAYNHVSSYRWLFCIQS